MRHGRRNTEQKCKSVATIENISKVDSPQYELKRWTHLNLNTWGGSEYVTHYRHLRPEPTSGCQRSDLFQICIGGGEWYYLPVFFLPPIRDYKMYGRPQIKSDPLQTKGPMAMWSGEQKVSWTNLRHRNFWIWRWAGCKCAFPPFLLWQVVPATNVPAPMYLSTWLIILNSTTQSKNLQCLTLLLVPLGQ